MTQDEALKVLKTGANVFLTGEPGSGKTHIINEYVRYLHSCGIEPAITASTGIAATHIGGQTLHSWSGIGVKSAITEEDLDALAQKERLVLRLRNARVLIVDEISMLGAETLASVEAVCRALRARPDQPFGGLQVVLVGDFFQLPPVTRAAVPQDNDNQTFFADTDGEAKSVFAFTSGAWRELNPLVCYLSEQHRHEDLRFLEILSAIRRGRVTDTVRAALKARRLAPTPNDACTRLFPHNVDVDARNTAELAKIEGQAKTFRMTASGAPPLILGLKRNCLSPETLTLKIGAKVMFTKNDLERRFVNGTLGAVTGFSPAGFPQVKLRSGRLVEALPLEWSIQDGAKVLAEITQVPLRLAWAITVHKSQGMSLDAAEMDLRNAFEYGQGYVALSRLRTLAGLFLSGFNERALEVHPEVRAADEEFRVRSEETREAFEKISVPELLKMHGNFIRAAGGSAGAGRRLKNEKPKTAEVTRALIAEGKALKDMAASRNLKAETIITHIEELRRAGGSLDIAYLKKELKPERFKKIAEAFKKAAAQSAAAKSPAESAGVLPPLSPVKTILGADFSYEEIRFARLFL